MITEYVASLSGSDGPEFSMSVDSRAVAGIATTTELGLCRVALEAITNLVRHARATHAEVSLQRVGDRIELRVADDGRGIAQPYVSGLGITSMRSRVEALGGTFEVSPRAGGGTTVLARVPVAG